jgi:signal transduction histidine kinase
VQRRKVKFTVDAALLRELGARLVGKPHIALAELIKNSYDADARHVRIVLGDDSIVVEDDGHGMSAEDFAAHWMRVGTTHKARKRNSPELGRPLTGSKGVGRLAAQLLASDLTITSVALVDPALGPFEARVAADDDELHEQFTARVDWSSAVEQNELTRVTVPLTIGEERETFAGGSHTGTRLVLTGLEAEWGRDDFRALAREIWALQPPFEVDLDDEQAFAIELDSEFGDVVSDFGREMNLIFDAWHGLVRGELLPDEPDREVLFEFDPLEDHDEDEDDEDRDDEDEDEGAEDEPPHRTVGVTKLLRLDIELKTPARTVTHEYIRITGCPIDTLSTEIRVFNLRNRQAHGILVSRARDYMKTFGGVHIYDDRFRLPYYGPEDWLNIERDHARRLSRSQLVPESLRIAKALQDLPSRRRLFGTATISTAHEQQTATERHLSDTEALAIQVSRDRLNDNMAFTALRNIVRLTLDLYTTEVARAKAIGGASKRRGATPPAKPSEDLAAVRDVVAAAKSNLTARQYESITDYVDEAEKNLRIIEDSTGSQAALLGTLATVGMTTLAWEHEATKQRLVVLDAANALRRATTLDEQRLREVVSTQAERLDESAQRLNDVARLFRPVLDREARETKTTLRARRFIQRTVKQLDVLARGAAVYAEDVPSDLMLPTGTFSGWSAIFQNLLVNAFNAVLERDERNVQIDAGTQARTSWIHIQDTGVGVDLSEAEKYFQPFVRGMADDPRRAQLGLGGSGLGLTIVRMIADSMGVSVRFIEPGEGFATCVALEWDTPKGRK